MRKILIFFLLVLNGDLVAQKLVTSAIAESTVAGYELGGSVQNESRGKWRLGIFYQTSMIEREGSEGIDKNHFYGMLISMPLVRSEKLVFYGIARAGIVNKGFIVFVPGLETDVRILKNISCGIGMSLRKGFPAASVKFNFSI